MIAPTHHPNLAPWDTIFPEATRVTYRSGEDIVSAGHEVDRIFWVEKGAVVETRTDNAGTSHAVNLSGPGSLIGMRLTSTGSGIHEVRATALSETVLRSMPRDEFLGMAMRRGELASAVMHDLARRTEIARRLSDSCNCTSTSRHVLDVLEVVSLTFGQDAAGTSTVAVPAALLERMTGCPWLLIRSSLTDLQVNGQVELGADGVRVRALVS